jgi:prepilin-type N-terminal cleavage/methylation domain-containing protein
MKTLRTRKSGFTLVEMLVVVTLIAIVATIAIALLGGASKDASETVNGAVMKQLTSNIGSYMQLHSGAMPDKFDSLINSLAVGTEVGGFSTLTTTLSTGGSVSVATTPGAVLTIGYDPEPDGVVNDTTATYKGLDTAGWSGGFRSLTVSKLTTNDVDRLAKLGITTVYDMVGSTKDLFNGEFPYTTTSRALKVGDPVVVLDPQTQRNGKSIYDEFGFHDIFNTTNYPTTGGTTTGDLTDQGRANALVSARYVVFGLGRYCTMVGDRKAGLQECPKSPIMRAGYYNRYLVVVKIVTGATQTDTDADFAGILDPMGNTTRSASSWATRTGK